MPPGARGAAPGRCCLSGRGQDGDFTSRFHRATGIYLCPAYALLFLAAGVYAFGQWTALLAANANRQAAEVNAAAMRGLLDGLRQRADARTCGDAGEGYEP